MAKQFGGKVVVVTGGSRRIGAPSRAKAHRPCWRRRARPIFPKARKSSALALVLCAPVSRHIEGTVIAVDGGAAPGLV